MAEQNNSFPTISEKNWWTIREKFKSSLPSVVSTTYIKSLLSMANDNSANSNVISPLKRIGLIDDENKPTALANDWRIDDKYKAVCETIIKSVYPTELLDLFPDSTVDRTAARTWFMSQGVGQGAADKMVALFSLLKGGEIKDKTSGFTKSTTTKPANLKQRKISANKTTSMSVTNQPAVGTDKNIDSINRPNLHIDLQIHISPDSTPDQIDTIFASMAKHLYGMNDK